MIIWKLCPRHWTRISATLSIWLPDNVLMVHNHQSKAFQQQPHCEFPFTRLFSERLDSNLGIPELCVCWGDTQKPEGSPTLWDNPMLIPHAYATSFSCSILGISFNPIYYAAFPSGRKKHLLIVFLVFYLRYLANCPSHKM